MTYYARWNPIERWWTSRAYVTSASVTCVYLKTRASVLCLWWDVNLLFQIIISIFIRIINCIIDIFLVATVIIENIKSSSPCQHELAWIGLTGGVTMMSCGLSAISPYEGANLYQRDSWNNFDTSSWLPWPSLLDRNGYGQIYGAMAIIAWLGIITIWEGTFKMIYFPLEML